MNKLKTIIGTAVLSLVSISTYSATLSPTSISGTGGAFFNLDKINDGYIPTEFAEWRENTTYWNGTDRVFTFDYGSLFNIDEVLVSVDNNDAYKVQWSVDNSTWNELFQITVNMGEVRDGMDTMTTFPSDEYISALNFSSVQTQYLRIFATGGDNSYSVGEFTAYGSAVSAVPIPAAALLFGPALLGLFGFRRSIKKSVINLN